MALKETHKLARYQLQQLKRNNEERFDIFLTSCRNQASKCRFRAKAESDERIIEQLTVGTKHKQIQEKLLEKSSLNVAIDIARTYEATISQLEVLDGERNKEINGIKIEQITTT